MPERTLTPHDAAQMIGTGAHNVRRWCEWHRAHLSPTANPGQDKPRRLTLKDVEVLRTVNELRKQGLQTAEINEQLATMTFATVEPESVPVAQNAPTIAQEGPQQALAPNPALSDLQTLLGPILENRIARMEKAQRDNVVMFLFGFLACGVLFGLLLLLFLVFR